ncbi:hypothetical protein PspLS_00642 [Pyricularia sp. CBS 133598]|nr:hypothetical protein PspLS_00642 [Pyricularia sp. CBS 133598]
MKSGDEAQFEAMAIDGLQSSDHHDLLNIIDSLRAQGVSQYVDLPEIIVCGDQSAGISSVLEAISGMSFPTKGNLCTRFATELILRRDVDKAVSITIIHGPDRSQDDKKCFSKFSCDLNQQALDKCMGIENGGRIFAKDVLRVELSGPSQPHLTLVDLPGLFNAAMVQYLVCDYMKRSIIVAVVSAKSDFALQSVTKFARKVDSNGERTIGIITKPNTLDAGSDSEFSYFKLAENKDVKFRLGWHILKNRDYKMRSASSEMRDLAKEQFFSSRTWASMDRSQLGTASPRPRLSNILKDPILHQLPILFRDISSGIDDGNARLSKLGQARSDADQEQRYLTQVSQEFYRLLHSAVNGIYTDHVFLGSATVEEDYPLRLRAVIQNILTDFAKEMRLHGDELPGTFNPLIIGDLFREHSRPWHGIVEKYVNCSLAAVRDVIELALEAVTVDKVANGILNFVINLTMELLEKNLRGKVAEVMKPYTDGYPITYNHYFTEEVQKLQRARRRKELEELLNSKHISNPFQGPTVQTGGSIFGSATGSGTQPPKTSTDDLATVSISDVVNTFVSKSEVNMEMFAAATALDYMLAYYKVAVKEVIDHIGVLAIEDCLIQKLPEIFSPATVHGLTADEIHNIAAESPEAAAERARATEKLKILHKGLRDLKIIDRRQSKTATQSFDKTE